MTARVTRRREFSGMISKGDRYVAFVGSGSGLRKGGPVAVAGQLAGSLSEIEFLPPDADTSRNLKLVDRSATYAHNDPSAAAPKVNAFLKRLIPFLTKISAK